MCSPYFAPPLSSHNALTILFLFLCCSLSGSHHRLSLKAASAHQSDRDGAPLTERGGRRKSDRDRDRDRDTQKDKEKDKEAKDPLTSSPSSSSSLTARRGISLEPLRIAASSPDTTIVPIAQPVSPSPGATATAPLKSGNARSDSILTGEENAMRRSLDRRRGSLPSHHARTLSERYGAERESTRRERQDRERRSVSGSRGGSRLSSGSLPLTASAVGACDTVRGSVFFESDDEDSGTEDEAGPNYTAAPAVPETIQNYRPLERALYNSW